MPRKYTFEFIKQQFELEDCQLLSTEYISSKKKLEYICSNKHRHSITWDTWQQGRRCLEYSVQRLRKNFDDIRKLFEKEGYKLSTQKYENGQQKLKYICPNGHNGTIRWNTWQQGSRCQQCAGLIKKTLEFVKHEFEKEGFILLNSEYLSNRQELDFICPNNHKHHISWSSWNAGHRCPYCAGVGKPTIEFIKLKFEKEGYTLLTDKYINTKQKLKYICPSGHRHQVTWHNWDAVKNRCFYCSIKASGDRKRLGYDIVKNIFKKENYTLLSTTYKNENYKLLCRCPSNHKYFVSLNAFKRGDRCFSCYKIKRKEIAKQRWADPVFQKKIQKSFNRKPNKPETALLDLLNQLFPNEYKYVGDFQFFLGGKNPDFMNCNSKKLLVEMWGSYWHRNDDPQARIDHFKQFGFDTCIVGDGELKDQETLVKKLREFHETQHTH